jgi:putative ABC transport system permease protein
MFWFFAYRFTILPVLLTIPVFLLLGWLIPCMMYDNTAKCSVVEQLRDAQ